LNSNAQAIWNQVTVLGTLFARFPVFLHERLLDSGRLAAHRVHIKENRHGLL
jgi:hypothetical protein